MRGRKPKPTRLKLLDGNPGKRAINHREPRPAAGVPSPPRFLTREARAEWRRVAGELGRIGVLTRVDRAVLTAYCQTWGRWYEAERQVTEGGITFQVMTKSGPMVVVNPAFRAAKDCLVLLRAYLSELGLSPASRVRIKASPPEEEDELERVMKAKLGAAGGAA